MSNKKGLIALSPLFVFITIYLVTSIIVRDFYKIPITVAFMIASIYAIAVVCKGSIDKRIEIFCKGAGTTNMMLMIMIFLLAGAFASSAKAMGCVDATVNITLAILPNNILIAGLFIAACFVSISIGTSVGTIAALVPIATGLAQQTGENTAFLTAIVVGGAFFGDNLSFISDTTIMATRTQNCKMSDKFRTNLFIVLPAAIIVFIIYIIMGQSVSAIETDKIDVWKVLPYLVVIISAICGLNVLAVLTMGIIVCGAIGLLYGDFDIYGFLSSLSNGMLGMSELIIVTLLAAGLLETINAAGGIEYVIEKMTKHIHGKRGAEFTIGSLVAITNICTANNTIAILTVGDIAKRISQKYGVDPRKAASLLDTFSCFMQGLLPYGAQILIAAGLARVNPIEIIPYLYYPFVMGMFAVLSIILRFPKKYS